MLSTTTALGPSKANGKLAEPIAAGPLKDRRAVAFIRCAKTDHKGPQRQMDAISAFAKQNSIQLDRAFVHVGTGSGIVSATIRQIVQRKQEANFELLVVTDLSRLNHESQSAFEIVREFLSAGVTVIAIDQKRSAGDSTEH